MQIVKIGGIILLVLCYALAFGYVFMLVEPTYYCVTRGCGGPGEGDIFFIPFIFGLGGVPVTVAALAHSIVQMKKKSRWAWLFRIFAVVFGTDDRCQVIITAFGNEGAQPLSPMPVGKLKLQYSV